MVDIRLMKENPEPIRASQRARGNDPATVDTAITADNKRLEALQTFENARAERKAFSKQIGKASKEERPALLEEAKRMNEKVKTLEETVNETVTAAKQAAMVLENQILDGIPSDSEDDYEVLFQEGTPICDFAAEGFKPKGRLDLGLGSDTVDTDRGVKISGSCFYYLKEVGARLELAILNAAIDTAIAHSFTSIVTPYMVSPITMSGTGFLGEHSDGVYYLPTDDLYLTGTPEVALAGYHTDEIIDLSAGLKRYSGWSACFRREAGSYGKDTRGIIWVHQFREVKVFSYCRPEKSVEEHQKLLNMERKMLTKMELPYRVIDTAAGGLSSPAAQKFGCEAWLPAQRRFAGVTSTSNYATFQARHLNIRYRDENRKTQTYVTFNGTLGTARWIVTILENHQQADGSVRAPAGLYPYMGGLEVLEPVK